MGVVSWAPSASQASMNKGHHCLSRGSHVPRFCSCHPHTLLGVPAREQSGTTAHKKASHSLPSYFLGARPHAQLLWVKVLAYLASGMSPQGWPEPSFPHSMA